MQEIKSRGRRLDNGEWVYGSIMVIEDTYFIIKPIDFSYDNDADATAFWFDCTEQEVDPVTIGQYTGLKDKNGNDIYAGDVLRWHKNYSPKVVLWFVCQFNVGNGESSMPLLYLGEKYALEVIGNIHDNPELLKTE